MTDILSDPRAFFKFTSCGHCAAAPCDRLRFGGVYPGKSLLVHNSLAGLVLFDCPFAAASFDEAEFLLGRLSLLDLIWEIDRVITRFSIAEELQYDQQHFVLDYRDRAGRMAFVEALWRDRVVTLLRVPILYAGDDNLRAWLRAYESPMILPTRPREEPALTDSAPASAAAAAIIVVVNPRWKHTAEQRAKESPAAARAGDTVLLMVDVKGIREGAATSFTVYDSQQSTGKKIEALSGANHGGTASVTWTVKLAARPGKRADSVELDFDGSVREKSSELGKIPVKTGVFGFSS